MKRILVVFICMLMVGNVFAINDWRQGSNTAPVEGTANPSDIDTNSENYAFAPLDKLLSHYLYGCTLTWASNSTITVGIGEVTCSDAAGTVKRMRKNTVAATLDMAVVGIGGIDAGSAEEASKWYSIYAIADADATTFTITCTKQGIALSGAGTTYRRYIGSVYNDAGNDISNFFWFGNGPDITIMWDVPIQITAVVSAGVWSGATSCAAAMPSSSTAAYFGVWAQHAGTQSAVWLKPNGSTGSINVEDAATLQTAANQVANGPVLCLTDSSQQIQYYNDAGDAATAISVKGFIINR